MTYFAAGGEGKLRPTRIEQIEKPLRELQERIEELKRLVEERGLDKRKEIEKLERRRDELWEQIRQTLTAWDKVQLARHPQRPYTLDYISRICEDFVELHGDRCFGEDPAIVGGLVKIEGRACVIMGHQKGRDVFERKWRNFGSPRAEGFRKALRLINLAAKYRIPLISFLDTPGASCLEEAEERGVAEAIARCQMTMAQLPVPIVVVVIGEGGSGGAIAIGVGDKVYILEHAYYSVILPEPCASIIYRDAKKGPEAAEALKLTAQDLYELGVVDGIIPEPVGGAHWDPDETARRVKEKILSTLDELSPIPSEELVERRYEKYRKMSVFFEGERLVGKPLGGLEAKEP